MIEKYVAGCDSHQLRIVSLVRRSSLDLLVRGAVQIDLHIAGAANALLRRQVIASARMQIVKALSGAAIGCDPYILQQAAATFGEFRGSRGAHREFRTVSNHLRE